MDYEHIDFEAYAILYFYFNSSLLLGLVGDSLGNILPFEVLLASPQYDDAEVYSVAGVFE